jgi:hypothetical protein
MRVTLIALAVRYVCQEIGRQQILKSINTEGTTTGRLKSTDFTQSNTPKPGQFFTFFE